MQKTLNFIFTLFSLGLSVYAAFQVFTGPIEKNSALILFGVTILLLTFTCIALAVDAGKHQSHRDHWSVEKDLYQEQIKGLYAKASNSTVALYTQSKMFHDIYHYLRTTNLSIDALYSKVVADCPERKQTVSNKELEELQVRLHMYLQHILASIHSHFSQYTDDECSICIKIAKDNMYKTLYRDPVTYRRRRLNDWAEDGKRRVYRINENSGLSAITAKGNQMSTFLSDNLKSLRDYHNPSPGWQNFYNATAVVPICRSSKPGIVDDDTHIIGYLSVDNMKGNLESEIIKESLCAIADGLYIILSKYEEIIHFANDNGTEHESVEFFTSWNRH